jgi:anion transporter
VIDLASVPLFASLSSVERARLVQQLQELSVAAGTVLFRQGDSGDCVYIVRSGVAEARAGSGHEADYPLALFERGDTFGEMALLTDEPRSTTIVALTDLELWALPKDRFLALVKQTPELALALGRLLSRRLQATNQAVSAMRGPFDVAAEQAYLDLDPELQRFLLRTAPLEQVTSDLAAKALDRADADQVLAYLAARLSFVTREASGVYRYHRLFRELLLEKLSAELGEQGRRQLLHRLADAARGVGQVEEALALLVEADDLEGATVLAAEQARLLFGAGHLEQAERLLASLPANGGDSSRGLADVKAELLAARGRPLEAIGVLEAAVRDQGPPASTADEAHLMERYRHLAEINFQLGRSREGMRWLRQAGEVDGRQAFGEFEQLVPAAAKGRPSGAWSQGLMALASLAGLRAASATAGVLGGLGASRPIGVSLSVGLLAWFLATPPPVGLSREAYLALGILAAALPLLIFSVLADHLVTLLMAVGWAALGLVPARVALSGFATPGWFLVLAVLAIGVALARSGLLYRVVLALLARAPSRHSLLTLALAGAGLVFSPAMPNATARTALAAPLVLEMSDALGYARRSRASAALAMAMLLGFGQMCTLFLTGSSSGLLVHSLLPPESRARFGWGNWALTALPLHLVIFALTYLAVLLILRPECRTAPSPTKLRAQRQTLGPLSAGERVAAVVFIVLLIAFGVGPLFGVDPAWPAVIALVVLLATNVLDQQSFTSGTNWPFLIFFGVMLSLAEVFSTLNVDTWLAAAAASPLAPLAANPSLFLVAVGLVGYAINLVMRWQAACVLMTLVLVPAVAPFGVEPWVVGMTALVTTNMWFLPYQSTIYQALYYGTDEQAFTHSQVRPIAIVYGFACLAGLVASVPLWQAMGLLP